jgi:hypothetical protein
VFFLLSCCKLQQFYFNYLFEFVFSSLAAADVYRCVNTVFSGAYDYDALTVFHGVFLVLVSEFDGSALKFDVSILEAIFSAAILHCSETNRDLFSMPQKELGVHSESSLESFDCTLLHSAWAQARFALCVSMFDQNVNAKQQELLAFSELVSLVTSPTVAYLQNWHSSPDAFYRRFVSAVVTASRSATARNPKRRGPGAVLTKQNMLPSELRCNFIPSYCPCILTCCSTC